MAIETNGVRITFLGHDSFRFECGGKKVYIDPFKLSANDKADLILVTHGHFDHCSIADLNNLSTQKTMVITTPDTTSKLAGKVGAGDMKLATPGTKIDLDWIKVEAVPAYNIGKEFHPKDNQWVGYIITLNGVRIYHAGDTDLIQEMSNFKCNVALLPVSGTYVMTAQEAAKAAAAIKPNLAIPMHYGAGVVGELSDASRFKQLCTACDVRILEKEN